MPFRLDDQVAALVEMGMDRLAVGAGFTDATVLVDVLGLHPHQAEQLRLVVEHALVFVGRQRAAAGTGIAHLLLGRHVGDFSAFPVIAGNAHEGDLGFVACVALERAGAVLEHAQALVQRRPERVLRIPFLHRVVDLVAVHAPGGRQQRFLVLLLVGKGEVEGRDRIGLQVLHHRLRVGLRRRVAGELVAELVDDAVLDLGGGLGPRLGVLSGFGRAVAAGEFRVLEQDVLATVLGFGKIALDDLAVRTHMVLQPLVAVGVAFALARGEQVAAERLAQAVFLWLAALAVELDRERGGGRLLAVGAVLDDGVDELGLAGVQTLGHGAIMAAGLAVVRNEFLVAAGRRRVAGDGAGRVLLAGRGNVRCAVGQCLHHLVEALVGRRPQLVPAGPRLFRIFEGAAQRVAAGQDVVAQGRALAGDGVGGGVATFLAALLARGVDVVLQAIGVGFAQRFEIALLLGRGVARARVDRLDAVERKRDLAVGAVEIFEHILEFVGVLPAQLVQLRRGERALDAFDPPLVVGIVDRGLHLRKGGSDVVAMQVVDGGVDVVVVGAVGREGLEQLDAHARLEVAAVLVGIDVRDRRALQLRDVAQRADDILDLRGEGLERLRDLALLVGDDPAHLGLRGGQQRCDALVGLRLAGDLSSAGDELVRDLLGLGGLRIRGRRRGGRCTLRSLAAAIAGHRPGHGFPGLRHPLASLGVLRRVSRHCRAQRPLERLADRLGHLVEWFHRVRDLRFQ